MSICRIAPLAAMLLSLWTIVGWSQQSEAATEQRLVRLLGRPLSANAVDENGWTDLHYAAALNLPLLAASLLDTGSDVGAALKTDGESLSERVRTVLLSVEEGCFEPGGLSGLPRWLVSERHGQTPLHLAVLCRHLAVVTVLLEAGADPNTALYLAGYSVVTMLSPRVRALLREASPSEQRVAEMIEKIDDGLCRTFSENEFVRITKRLKNSSRRFMGREVTLDEAYFHLRCDQLFAYGLDLIRVPIEVPLDTQKSGHELVLWFVREAQDKRLLGKIVSCRQDFGGGCLNVSEHIEKNMREATERDSPNLAEWIKEFKEMLYHYIPEENIIYDREFCRRLLDEPRHCSVDQ